MKQFLLAAAVLTASLSGPASAADLARPRAHAVYGPAVAFYNWTGCYVGGNGGGFWARRDWSNPVFGGGGFGDETASGGLGGVQVGCNYQIGQWVLGVQGDWDWISATNSTANIAFPLFTDQSDTKSQPLKQPYACRLSTASTPGLPNAEGRIAVTSLCLRSYKGSNCFQRVLSALCNQAYSNPGP